MKKTISVFILSFIFLIVGFTSIYAEKNSDKDSVKNLIKVKTTEAIKLINNKKLTEQEKKDKIFEIISPTFDFNIMSKLVLGKKEWKKLTKEQKEKFIKLFAKRIKMVYLDRVSISGKLDVSFKEPVQKNKKIIYVPASFFVTNKNYSVVFKLWKSRKGWKIYDIEVEGISIIRTYKSQFASILKNGNINDLLKKLEQNKETK